MYIELAVIFQTFTFSRFVSFTSVQIFVVVSFCQ